MKRIIALLLCLVMVVCVIASCGEPEEVHSHTYSETWSSDAVGHWYQATCDCEDAPEQKFSHVDKNNDGACDVCEYKMACADGHTYAEGWTVDCTNHWNAADCGHIVAGANVAAHADANNDGECDVCKYVINDIHTHYFDTKWTGDGEYHWHAALCEHGVEVADKAAHVLNAAGYCTVCDAKVKDIDPTDLAAVLAAAVARNDKVAFGDVIASEAVYGGIGAQTLENGKTNKVHFALGNGESYIQYISFDKTGAFIGQNEQWFEDLGNGEVFGAEMESGEYELAPIAGAAQFLNGYNYTPGSVIASDSVDTSTLANMLSALYDQMNEGVRVKDATKGIKDGVYFFSYTYYSVNATTVGGELYTVELEYYNVDVEFTVNEDLIIDTANFQVEVYRDYENDSDLDYTYTDNGDGTVTISEYPTLKATANPSFYNYSVAQMSGERTFTTPYPRASLLPSSFELLYVLETEDDENGNDIPTVTAPIGESIDIVSGTYASFAIGDILPVTASSKFINSDDFTFEFVNNDPDSTGRAWYMDPGSVDEMLNGYSAYTGVLKLKLRDAGSYTVTISFGDISKTFVLNVTAAPVTEITGDADSISVKLTDFYTYDNNDQSYVYTATAEGNYTFTLPAGLGARLDGEDAPAVDLYDNGGVFTVGLNAGESVKIYFAAGDTNKYEVTIAYEAADIPDNEGGDQPGGDDPISGAVTIDGIVGTYNVGTIGTLTINADGTAVYAYTQNGKDYTTTYTFEIAGGEFKFLTMNDNPFNNNMATYFGILTFNAEGKPATFTHNGTEHTLTTGGSTGGDEPEQPGDETNGSGTASDPYILTAPGNFTCAFPGGYTPIWYTFTATENCYVTVSSTFDTAWLQIGADTYSATQNNGDGQPVKMLVLKGETVYIGVADWDEAKVDVPFAVSTESVTMKPVDFLAGSWAGSEDAMWGTADYIITINADGTGSGSYDMGYGPTTFDITAILYIGDTITMKTITTGAYGGTKSDLEFTYGPNTLTCAQAMMMGELVLTPYSGDVGGGDTPAVDYNTTIVAGENSLFFSADEVAANTATRPLTITAPGAYKFNSGSLFISSIKDASGTAITKNDDYTYTLTAGNYTVTFGMLSSFGVKPDVAQTLNLINTTGDQPGTETNGTGTDSDPYVLTAPGDYTCAFPGGYNPIWYSFIPTESGYITVSSTFGDGAWLQAGTDIMSTKSNSGNGTAVKVYVQGGVLCYIGVADWSEVASTVPFTVTFEAGELVPDGTTDAPFAAALNTQTTANFLASNPIWYYFNATADGYLTVTSAYAKANLQIGANFYDTVCNVGFDENFNTVINSSVTLYVTAGNTYYIGVYDNDYNVANIDFTVSFREFKSDSTAFLEGTWTGSESAWGSVAQYLINLGANGTGSGSYDMGYGPTTFDVTFALVDGTTVTLYTVTTGEYGGTKTNLVFTYDATAGTLTTDKAMMESALTLTKSTGGSEGGDEGGSTKPNGTANNPYVVDELPYTITVSGNHDMYYTYTATEETTIEVSYVAGSLVSFTIDGDFLSPNNSGTAYVVTVPAGKTIVINPWTMSAEAVDYTYVISVYEPTQGGGEGGETTGAVSWIGANGSGRAMKVTIDKAAGTMSIIRAALAGNSLDTATGATEATYTYSFDGTNVTYTLVSGQNCTVTFDGDGNPVSVIWGSATYTGFTVEA